MSDDRLRVLVTSSSVSREGGGVSEALRCSSAALKKLGVRIDIVSARETFTETDLDIELRKVFEKI